MQYTIQNNGKDHVMIRVLAPSHLASSFLAFIEQKSRENVPIVKPPSHVRNENYLTELTAFACNIYDASVFAGSSSKSAISETNYKLKAHGYANTSYDITKQILQKAGKLKRKK